MILDYYARQRTKTQPEFENGDVVQLVKERGQLSVVLNAIPFQYKLET